MTTDNLYKIVSVISAISILIPITFCFYKIKAHNKNSWALFIYLMLSFGIELFSLLVIEKKEQSETLFNVFTLVEFSIFSYLYYSEFAHKTMQRIVLLFLLFFLIIASFFFIYKNEYNQADNIVHSLEAIIIVFFSAYYFYLLLLKQSDIKITDDYFYWINLALLLYFSSALLIFLNTRFLEHCRPTTAYIIWGLHQLLNLLTNILISIGIWKLKPKQY